MTARKQPTEWADLVGKFFHTFCVGGRAQTQGRIMARLDDGYYMIQMFEWLTGSPSFTGTKLVHISAMAQEHWAWYATNEDMREAYQYGGIDHEHGVKCPCQTREDDE